MTRCDCPDRGNVFSTKTAQGELKRYRRSGPDRSTRRLIEAIRAEHVEGATILDIGAGIGAIQLELLAAGAGSAMSVDVSPAFVATAKAEAERRGLGDRIAHRQGDFVTLASEIEPADVVTLARVVCCYPDMPALIARATERARRMIGLVYPRDAWWVRLGARLMNPLTARLQDGIRIYIHPVDEMDRIIRSAGFERAVIDRGPFWQTALYVRATTPAP